MMKEYIELLDKYYEILSSLDVTFFDKHHPNTKFHEKTGLSGVFFSSLPENYFQAKNKIMIIGSETTGWDILQKQPYLGLKEYINSSVEKHNIFFQKQLSLQKCKAITFHDFTRLVAEKSGGNGIVYSNLFCFSWKRGSPIKNENFHLIKDISKKLLIAQLDFFKPEIIIFANGMSSVKHRREYFPLANCTNTVIYEDEGISKNHLWKFDYDKKYLCYRIQHPSTIRGRVSAEKARQKLISLLPDI